MSPAVVTTDRLDVLPVAVDIQLTLMTFPPPDLSFTVTMAALNAVPMNYRPFGEREIELFIKCLFCYTPVVSFVNEPEA